MPRDNGRTMAPGKMMTGRRKRSLTLLGSAAVASTLLAACGGPTTAVNSTTTTISSGSATTPAVGSGSAQTVTSPGPVNPAAVPLGDGYVSLTPKVGYVNSCTTSFGGIGGAQTNGPWINTANKTWDPLTKIHVQGNASWTAASYSNTVSDASRVLNFNGLPIDHTTGIFPIASSDPAHQYDHNSNHIAAQSFNWSLPATPAAASNPTCTPGGPIGVLVDGVALFNALDGQGRDAAAHEVLDAYSGHPDPSSTYHHHDVPSYMIAKDTAPSTLVGYALDGYGIYVERNAAGSLLTNTDLDACHGRTSSVLWNGKATVIYHFDATIEYPYTVGCFHGTPTSLGHQGGPGSGAGGPPAP